MGKLPKQTKRQKLIKRLHELGFDGPHGGVGDHPQYMRRMQRTVKLPNMHRGDIGEGLLKKVLEEAGVSVDEWLGSSLATRDPQTHGEASGAASQNGPDRKTAAR